MNRGFWRKNGLKNGVRIWFTTGLPQLWDYVNSSPRLRRVFNKWLINRMVYTMPTRPLRMSSYSDYRSWPALADRSIGVRAICRPMRHCRRGCPNSCASSTLFERSTVGDRPSPKSTLLFPHFAQWFVDGFLRTDPEELSKKNTSTHEIDLSQLYGQTVEVTRMLRSCSETAKGDG